MVRKSINTCQFGAAIALVAAFCPPVAASDNEAIKPAGPTRIMPLDEVRTGMKGYGLTVFQGDTIEPFAVEVVSVMRDISPRGGGVGPKRGLIWIVCPDERMQHSGPVSGMSGSPIYLWDKAEDQQPGKGGRLIGAFAMGYPLVKTCYAGVQPIESMRQVGQRARSGQPSSDAATGGADLARMLRGVLDVATEQRLGRAQTWRAQVLADIVGDAAARAPPRRPDPPAPAPALGSGAHAVRLMLPVPIASQKQHQFLAPLLEPMGMMPVSSAGAVAGKPPPGIDPQSIRLEPGSVLAIPLLWGDLDISATGTCTEILPDGRVLAFGHAMFGLGDAALPMATGYVHFILPRVTMSFKVGGSAVLQRGAIVRDELSAVIGRTDGEFETAAMRVHVQMPDQKTQSYHYTLVHHRLLTPVLAAFGIMDSVSAEQNLPMENTVRIRGTLRFGNGRDLKINSLTPWGSDISTAIQMLGPLAMMANNPYEPLLVDDIDVTVQIEPQVRSAVLLHVRADRAEYAPGQIVAITLSYQPYRKPRQERRIEFPLPKRIEDGTYTITVGSGQGYFQELLQQRPHLTYTDQMDDLVDLLEQLLAVEDDALYLTMQMPFKGLAIRRRELPKLPSSRRAMIASPTGTGATPFVDWIVKKVELGLVPEGEGSLKIQVRRDLKRS